MKTLVLLLILTISTGAFAGSYHLRICNEMSQLIGDINSVTSHNNRYNYKIHSDKDLSTGRYPIQTARKAALVEWLLDSWKLVSWAIGGPPPMAAWRNGIPTQSPILLANKLFETIGISETNNNLLKFFQNQTNGNAYIKLKIRQMKHSWWN